MTRPGFTALEERDNKYNEIEKTIEIVWLIALQTSKNMPCPFSSSAAEFNEFEKIKQLPAEEDPPYGKRLLQSSFIALVVFIRYLTHM